MHRPDWSSANAQLAPGLLHVNDRVLAAAVGTYVERALAGPHGQIESPIRLGSVTVAANDAKSALLLVRILLGGAIEHGRPHRPAGLVHDAAGQFQSSMNVEICFQWIEPSHVGKKLGSMIEIRHALCARDGDCVVLL